MTEQITAIDYVNNYMLIKNFFGEGEARFKEFDNDFNRFFIKNLKEYNSEVEEKQINELIKASKKDHEGWEEFILECIEHKALPDPRDIEKDLTN